MIFVVTLLTVSIRLINVKSSPYSCSAEKGMTVGLRDRAAKSAQRGPLMKKAEPTPGQK